MSRFIKIFFVILLSSIFFIKGFCNANDDKSFYYFFSDDCKQCSQLKDFIEENGFKQKYDINYFQISHKKLDDVFTGDNPSCGGEEETELMEDKNTCSVITQRENYIRFLEYCGKEYLDLPVFVYKTDGNYECLQGEKEIKNYLRTCNIKKDISNPSSCDDKFGYTLYHSFSCSHCQKVIDYFEENNILKKYNIKLKEISTNNENTQEYSDFTKKCGVNTNGIPFLKIKGPEKSGYLVGDRDIISHFKNLNKENKREDVKKCETSDKGIIFMLIPTALSDSINPCAFAVILILLSSILQKRRRRRDAIISGLMFVLAIFISYFFIGYFLVKVIGANVQNAIGDYLKIGIGLLGIVLGLFNLKDFFWYGKGFVMEVPQSWRPKMSKFIEGIVSYPGAFVIGIIVSLFLLPCTAGPYVVFSGYLAGTSGVVSIIESIGYLLLYNVIFVLPMLIIIFLVSFGLKSVNELNQLRMKNIRLLHLIVGLILLFLGIYVLNDVYSFVGFL